MKCHWVLLKKGAVFVSLLVLITMVSGCEKENTSGSEFFYQDLELTYVKSENKTIARAYFRETPNGQPSELSDPASILVNGDQLQFITLNQNYYITTYSPSIDELIYIFTDVDQQIYTNTLNESEIGPIDFQDTLSTISISDDFFLIWVGDSISPGETIRISIFAQEQGMFAGTIDQVGLTQVIFTKEQMAEIGTGTRGFRIERIKERALQEKNSLGGKATLIYSSGNRDVLLVD